MSAVYVGKPSAQSISEEFQKLANYEMNNDEQALILESFK